MVHFAFCRISNSIIQMARALNCKWFAETFSLVLPQKPVSLCFAANHRWQTQRNDRMDHGFAMRARKINLKITYNFKGKLYPVCDVKMNSLLPENIQKVFSCRKNRLSKQSSTGRKTWGHNIFTLCGRRSRA